MNLLDIICKRSVGAQMRKMKCCSVVKASINDLLMICRSVQRNVIAALKQVEASACFKTMLPINQIHLPMPLLPQQVNDVTSNVFCENKRLQFEVPTSAPITKPPAITRLSRIQTSQSVLPAKQQRPT